MELVIVTAEWRSSMMASGNEFAAVIGVRKKLMWCARKSAVAFLWFSLQYNTLERGKA